MRRHEHDKSENQSFKVLASFYVQSLNIEIIIMKVSY